MRVLSSWEDCFADACSPGSLRRPIKERAKCDGDASARTLPGSGDFVRPVLIGRPGQNNDAAMADFEIDKTRLPGLAHAKRSFFSERNSHDRGAPRQTFRTVAMTADVMALLAVVPVDQEAVQSSVDRFARPITKHLQFWRSRAGVVSRASVDVIPVEGLLPTRGSDESAMHHDLVIVARMRSPKFVESAVCRCNGRRRRSDEEAMRIVEIMPREVGIV